MAKRVRYIGGSQRYYSCTNPDELVVGQVYTVLMSKDKGYQTNYTLLEVEGEFNSVWFETVKGEDSTWIGVAGKLPVIAKSFAFSRIYIVNGTARMTQGIIHHVENARDLGNNVYLVIGDGQYVYILVG